MNALSLLLLGDVLAAAVDGTRLPVDEIVKAREAWDAAPVVAVGCRGAEPADASNATRLCEGLVAALLAHAAVGSAFLLAGDDGEPSAAGIAGARRGATLVVLATAHGADAQIVVVNARGYEKLRQELPGVFGAASPVATAPPPAPRPPGATDAAVFARRQFEREALTYSASKKSAVRASGNIVGSVRLGELSRSRRLESALETVERNANINSCVGVMALLSTLNLFFCSPALASAVGLVAAVAVGSNGSSSAAIAIGAGGCCSGFLFAAPGFLFWLVAALVMPLILPVTTDKAAVKDGVTRHNRRVAKKLGLRPSELGEEYQPSAIDEEDGE